MTAFRTPGEPPEEPTNRYTVGTKVDVLHQGSWSNATIKKVISTNRWLIGYDGWGTNWDEEVGPDRIRPRKPWTAWSGVITVVTVGVIIFAGMAVAHFFNQGAAYHPYGASSGTQPRSGYDLSRGQSVIVEWNGTWYEATVVSADDSSHATVHYDGYSSSYDESVELTRIRVR